MERRRERRPDSRCGKDDRAPQLLQRGKGTATAGYRQRREVICGVKLETREEGSTLAELVAAG
jgi:hypothetical protein